MNDHRTRGPLTAAIVALILMASATLQAEDLVTLEARLEQAWNDRDEQELLAARAVAEQYHGDADRVFYARYLAAWASYRLGLMHEGDRRRAREELTSCIDDLTDLIGDRDDGLAAEAHALLASCYGSSTAHYRLGAPARGNRAQANLDRALELAPDNPRVVLQDALSDYSRPALFGGDKDRAAEKLERAIELYADEQPAGSQPRWGEADAWLYLGRILEQRGQAGKAREAYGRALELAPGNPEVEQALAR